MPAWGCAARAADGTVTGLTNVTGVNGVAAVATGFPFAAMTTELMGFCLAAAGAALALVHTGAAVAQKRFNFLAAAILAAASPPPKTWCVSCLLSVEAASTCASSLGPTDQDASPCSGPSRLFPDEIPAAFTATKSSHRPPASTGTRPRRITGYRMLVLTYLMSTAGLPRHCVQCVSF